MSHRSEMGLNRYDDRQLGLLRVEAFLSTTFAFVTAGRSAGIDGRDFEEIFEKQVSDKVEEWKRFSPANKVDPKVGDLFSLLMAEQWSFFLTHFSSSAE